MARKSRDLRLDPINIPPGWRGNWPEPHRFGARRRRFNFRHIVRICRSGGVLHQRFPATYYPIWRSDLVREWAELDQYQLILQNLR